MLNIPPDGTAGCAAPNMFVPCVGVPNEVEVVEPKFKFGVVVAALKLNPSGNENSLIKKRSRRLKLFLKI